MGVVKDLRADGGTDLDVLDLGKGDLDPSMRGKEAVDLSVKTVLGDEDQCAETGHESEHES